MLHLAVLSLVLALGSGVLTFAGLLGGYTWVGRVCFAGFLALFIVSAAAIVPIRRRES